MKKIFATLFALSLLFFPVVSFAHGELGEDEEHHMDEMMGGMMGGMMGSDEETKSNTIEPCEIGSVIKCGEHGEGSSQTLEAVINDLLVGFNVSSVAELDCDQIVDHDFKHVGEALMSYMHPDEEEHEAIDAMMGGEGSETLEAMHIHMGKRYLGCEEGAFGPMMMFGRDDGIVGMQGGMMGMMGGFGQTGFLGSMVGGGFLGVGLLQFIVWGLALVGLAWLISLVINKGKK